MAHILLKHIDHPGSRDIGVYMKSGGYRSLEKALAMKRSDIIDEMKHSGLRGRGGAGFSTGVKWSFSTLTPNLPKYLLCNADEGEPGTFKDRPILEENPHLLIEGMIISAYALGAEYGYIYLRREYPAALGILEKAIRDAYKNNLLGRDILGNGIQFQLSVFQGAGAYICGEETALIESMEGQRGQPRIKPPFPVTDGYVGKPTVINNVETLANVPYIIEAGGAAYSKIGSPSCPGPKLFSVSGHVKRPGVYELPMGISLREIIYDHCGGIRDDRALKAVIPGGISTPVLPANNIDCPMDFLNLPRHGSMLGSGAVMVFDETVDMSWVCLRATRFFEHESCGKCTPCREGVGWMAAILARMHAGQGNSGDIELLLNVALNISGNTLCPLGDGAASVVKSFLRHFRREFEEKLERKSCSAERA
ncbi:MAG: NADH-quinone oxidoreductase subunit NuoF [Dissulfurispiraceae bacterium]